MSRDERRTAITGPVEVAGAEILPVLTTRLLNDLGDDPDQLSILQHALHRRGASWQADGGEGRLNLRHYSAIGSTANALDRHAEKAYAELDGERERELCRKRLQALTDKSADPRGVRRPTNARHALCADRRLRGGDHRDHRRVQKAEPLVPDAAGGRDADIGDGDRHLPREPDAQVATARALGERGGAVDADLPPTRRDGGALRRRQGGPVARSRPAARPRVAAVQPSERGLGLALPSGLRGGDALSRRGRQGARGGARASLRGRRVPSRARAGARRRRGAAGAHRGARTGGAVSANGHWVVAAALVVSLGLAFLAGLQTWSKQNLAEQKETVEREETAEMETVEAYDQARSIAAKLTAEKTAAEREREEAYDQARSIAVKLTAEKVQLGTVEDTTTERLSRVVAEDVIKRQAMWQLIECGGLSLDEVPVSVAFDNDRRRAVRVLTLEPEGFELERGVVAAGEEAPLELFENDAWLVRLVPGDVLVEAGPVTDGAKVRLRERDGRMRLAILCPPRCASPFVTGRAERPCRARAAFVPDGAGDRSRVPKES